jgi:hypothetical protein
MVGSGPVEAGVHVGGTADNMFAGIDGSQASTFEAALLETAVPSPSSHPPAATARAAWFAAQAKLEVPIDFAALRAAHAAHVDEMRAQAARMRAPPEQVEVEQVQERKRICVRKWYVPTVTAADSCEELIGKRIKVWWGGDGVYFKGVVTAWRVRRGCLMHKVVYDDGEQKWHALDVGERWELKKV